MRREQGSSCCRPGPGDGCRQGPGGIGLRQPIRPGPRRALVQRGGDVVIGGGASGPIPGLGTEACVVCQESGYVNSSRTGLHQGWLIGPADAEFDLLLESR